jgi:hypothetical protein
LILVRLGRGFGDFCPGFLGIAGKSCLVNKLYLQINEGRLGSPARRKFE